MRIRRGSRKTTVIATFLVLAVAGAAFAYWTAGGGGTGNAETGTTLALEVNQAALVNDLAPGVAPQTLSGTFNNDNPGPVHVTSVTAALTSVTTTPGGITPVVGCTIADYTLTGAVMSAVQEVSAGDAQGTWSGATVAFNTTLDNQDACKDAFLNITYTII